MADSKPSSLSCFLSLGLARAGQSNGSTTLNLDATFWRYMLFPFLSKRANTNHSQKFFCVLVFDMYLPHGSRFGATIRVYNPNLLAGDSRVVFLEKTIEKIRIENENSIF